MDFGICLPNFQPGATAEGIDAAAAAAERAGWSTAWTTDHLVVGRGAAADYGGALDAVATLFWVAGRHPGLRLGTSVIVVPMRNAAILAKELASLDALAGDGRVLAGVGIGWHETEFANLGVLERMRVRGAYLDEAIALWRHLWSGSEEPFEGRFHALTDFVFAPLPARPLPILVGGVSDAALRRAGRLGDGWHASALSPARFGRRVPKVRAAAEEAGRPMPALSARARVRPDEREGAGYALRGTPEAIAAEIRAFAEQGVGHLALSFEPIDPDGVTAAVERFVREVVPLVDGDAQQRVDTTPRGCAHSTAWMTPGSPAASAAWGSPRTRRGRMSR